MLQFHTLVQEVRGQTHSVGWCRRVAVNSAFPFSGGIVLCTQERSFLGWERKRSCSSNHRITTLITPYVLKHVSMARLTWVGQGKVMTLVSMTSAVDGWSCRRKSYDRLHNYCICRSIDRWRRSKAVESHRGEQSHQVNRYISYLISDRVIQVHFNHSYILLLLWEIITFSGLLIFLYQIFFFLRFFSEDLCLLL